MNISGRFLFGRYADLGSPLHRLDARAKLFFIFTISVSLFAASGVTGFLAPFMLLVIAAVFSRVGLRGLGAGITPVLWLVAFTFILNYFASGLGSAAFLSIRLVLLFAWASLLTATTPAAETGRAISWFLTPLKVFGLSPGRVAFTFTMALRFFPLVLEEAESILKAQKVKGRKQGVVNSLSSFCTVFIIRVLRRADSIEDAVENRGLLEGDLSFVLKSRSGIGVSSAAVVVVALVCLFIAV